MSYQNIIQIITEHNRLIITGALSIITLLFLFQKQLVYLLVAFIFIGIGLLVQRHLHSSGYIECNILVYAIVSIAASVSFTRVILRLFDI